VKRKKKVKVYIVLIKALKKTCQVKLNYNINKRYNGQVTFTSLCPAKTSRSSILSVRFYLSSLQYLALTDNTMEVQVSRTKLSNAKDNHTFSFNHIFPGDSTQEDIFEGVAKPVIDNCLDGYNGTIFAYGQTGSGKTFTMSGGDDW
jgi:kinesin family protein 6/9